MIPRFAIPWLLLTVLLLPLPFVLCSVIFGVFLAVQPRGEPSLERVAVSRVARPHLLRSPPR
jgi:hypothetical protein